MKTVSQSKDGILTQEREWKPSFLFSMHFLATTLSPPNLISLESHSNYYLKNIHRSIATSKLLQLSSPLCQVCNGILGQCLTSGPCRITKHQRQWWWWSQVEPCCFSLCEMLDTNSDGGRISKQEFLACGSLIFHNITTDQMIKMSETIIEEDQVRQFF